MGLDPLPERVRALFGDLVSMTDLTTLDAVVTGLVILAYDYGFILVQCLPQQEPDHFQVEVGTKFSAQLFKGNQEQFPIARARFRMVLARFSVLSHQVNPGGYIGNHYGFQGDYVSIGEAAHGTIRARIETSNILGRLSLLIRS